MQNTELYRRGIVLPLTSEAEVLLRTNDIKMDMAVEYLEIPRQDFFTVLWDLRLFQEINSRTGSLIDDYEQELIDCELLGHVTNAISAVVNANPIMREETRQFLLEFRTLAEKGRTLKRPLLFVL